MRGRATGKLHLDQHLVRLSAVVSAPTKKSRASIQRSPRTDWACSRPPSASTIAGISDAGIGMREIAADGAAVADLRMRDVRQRLGDERQFGRASSDRVRGCDSASARRCANDPPPFFRMPANSFSGLMSISMAGCVRRKFIAGTRLWPPARNRASSPYSAFNVKACARTAGGDVAERCRFHSDGRVTKKPRRVLGRTMGKIAAESKIASSVAREDH